ncbi:MAG: bifunctional 3-(3-hydroxy-phenyl)propionate/3-hydroxycinnamic acid hydroxylase [Aeromicrobium erythreum]
MNRVPDRVPVLVVGAGPTGATAAIDLAQRGVDVTVLDRWDDVYPQPRAVHLDDEVYRLLGGLGVAEEFAAISRPAEGLQLVRRDLSVLARFDRSGVSPATGLPRANMFDQPDLERVLRDRMDRLDAVHLVGGVEVLAVERAGHQGTVRYRDLRDGTEGVVAADVVLGCDGANSVVRSALGARLDDLGFAQRWLVVDVETDLDLAQWEGVHQVCDHRRAATYMRIGTTRYRWELQLLGDEDATDFQHLDALLPLIEPWTGAAGAADDLKLVRVAEYTFRAAIADRWRDGPVFLLGDAAHLTPPFIGQGMGAGLRDATNLAWKVAGVLDGSLSVDVLDTYAPERSAHARAMITTARLVGQVMTGGGRVGDLARGLALPVLTRLPLLTARMRDSETPALDVGCWSVDGGGALVGTLCPDAELPAGRLDRVVGPGWALVTLTPPAPSDAARLAALGVVVVEASGTVLEPWLGRSQAALVRPDRTVLATSDVLSLTTTADRLLRPPRKDTP